MATRNTKKRRIAGRLVIALAGALLVFTGSADAGVDRELRCRVGKFKSVVKEFRDKAQCYERALKRSGLVEQSCLNRAERKREELVGRMQGAGICPANVSTDHYGQQIDIFFQGLNAEMSREIEKGTTASAKATTSASAKATTSASGLASPIPEILPTPDAKSAAPAARLDP